MAKVDDNVFPKVIEAMQATDPAAPSDASWKIYAKAPGIYARSSNSIVGPFGTGGGTITTKDEGSTLSTGVTTLDFVGSGVTASGAGATTTVTISGGGGSGGVVLLEQFTASSSATLDFASTISSTYDEYIFECVSIRPVTDGAMFVIRVGTGGGPTYDTGGNYNYGSLWKQITNNAVAQWGAASATYMSLFNDSAGVGLSNVAGTSLSATIHCYNPASSSLVKMFRWEMVFNYATDDNHYMVSGGGLYAPATALTAIRFLMSSGNISSGTVRSYGVAK